MIQCETREPDSAELTFAQNLDSEQIQSSRSQAEEAAVKKAEEEEVRDLFSFMLVSFASRVRRSIRFCFQIRFYLCVKRRLQNIELYLRFCSFC